MRECKTFLQKIKIKKRGCLRAFCEKKKIVRDTSSSVLTGTQALPPHALDFRVYPSSSWRELVSQGHWLVDIVD
jgi:hypothetical protein